MCDSTGKVAGHFVMSGVGEMKLVAAIIQPFKLQEVRTALLELGIEGMTATQVQGYGRQKGHSEIYRDEEYAVCFWPKFKIEVAVPAESVEKVMEAILRCARTGRIGDGKIFISRIEKAVRVRTGETGRIAL
jgi:nitrogen regulatory protein P-II 2